MSALPPIADIYQCDWNVRYGPISGHDAAHSIVSLTRIISDKGNSQQARRSETIFRIVMQRHPSGVMPLVLAEQNG